LLVLSAPSGAGKTTLARRFVDITAGASFSVSATTRAPRGAERDGVENQQRLAVFEIAEQGGAAGAAVDEVDGIAPVRGALKFFEEAQTHAVVSQQQVAEPEHQERRGG